MIEEIKRIIRPLRVYDEAPGRWPWLSMDAESELRCTLLVHACSAWPAREGALSLWRILSSVDWLSAHPFDAVALGEEVVAGVRVDWREPYRPC